RNTNWTTAAGAAARTALAQAARAPARDSQRRNSVQFKRKKRPRVELEAPGSFSRKCELLWLRSRLVDRLLHWRLFLRQIVDTHFALFQMDHERWIGFIGGQSSRRMHEGILCKFAGVGLARNLKLHVGGRRGIKFLIGGHERGLDYHRVRSASHFNHLTGDVWELQAARRRPS